MGIATGVSPKGGPVFNASPQTVTDLNALRAFAELIGNRKVGSQAQRESATGEDVWPGLAWFDTTLERTFYYDPVGGWKSQVIGTFTPNANPQYAPQASFETPVLSKAEGRARLHGFLTNVAGITFLAGTAYPLGSIPAGFRPAKTILRPAAPSPISAGQTWITITNAGAVSMAMQNGGTHAGGVWGIGFDLEWEAVA